MITLNIPSPRKKKAKKPPAKELWTRASHSVQNVSHWKNSESSTREFTAKASFRVLQEDHSLYSRGECFHINQEETLAKSCKCHKISEWLLVINHHKYSKFAVPLMNLLMCVLGLLVLFNVLPAGSASYIGLLWFFLPLQNFLTANRNVLYRIWRKSMLPYIQLYVSVTETWAFCDLCDWDTRIYIAAPSMLFNQIMIINSDAVYFRPQNKKIILAQVVVSILWKVICVAALRFGLYPNMTPRIMFTIMTKPNFFLHNASVYTQKTSSMIALLIGQIIFRVRHPEQAYSMRTNYTVKSNREWNELARKNRIQKKASLKYSVEETREMLAEEEVII